MPAPAENLNAFDLKLLKALINFKINKNYHKLLTVEDKKKLCRRYGAGGTLDLSPDYLIKVFPKRDEIRRDVTEDTLNQLCSILKKDYRWHVFTDDIEHFRPKGIHDDKPFSKLGASQQEKIDRAIKGFFFRYRTYEEFEKEVIDRVSRYSVAPEAINSIERDGREAIYNFAHRINVELTTRKAAIPFDEKHDVIEEVYDSWYKLFCTIREEIKSVPVTVIRSQERTADLFNLALMILNEVLRPHLTEHQSKFRSWMTKEKQNTKNKNLSLQQIQKKYPEYGSLLQSLKMTNRKLTAFSVKLAEFLN